MGLMAARLIVSLPVAEDGFGLHPGAETFAAALAERGLPLSLLVRPVGPAGPLAPGARVAGWLRERRSAGDELVLHGYDHSQRPLGPQTRIRRAEFSALPAHEAALRLAAARWVTDRAGLELTAFAPPAWRVSAGTLTALAARGFTTCADEAGVHLLGGPVPGAVRAPVLETGARTPEVLTTRLLVAKATRAARRGALVRIAVRGDDLRRPERRAALLGVVDFVLGSGASGATHGSATAVACAA